MEQLCKGSSFVQCCVDLSKNVLRIGTTGSETPFLSEQEAPTSAYQREEVGISYHCFLMWQLARFVPFSVCSICSWLSGCSWLPHDTVVSVRYWKKRIKRWLLLLQDLRGNTLREMTNNSKRQVSHPMIGSSIFIPLTLLWHPVLPSF